MEAKLYKKNSDKSVDCFLCRHKCHISEGRRGLCMVRKNKDGTLHTLFYGKPVALAVDPIEKKPLYHFLPASESFSVATVGCNFQCPFCQNWDISQYGRNESVRDSGYEASPEVIVEKAREAGCQTIAYTYSEPTIFFEYAYDIAKIADQYNIRNVYVTNGYMTREMLDEFDPYLHAANVDLKAFDEKTYRKEMKADLNGVLDSIKYMKKLGIWLEITTLIVTDMNDSKEELKDIAEFIAGVGKDIPWHISRFHPAYKEDGKSATSVDKLELAYELGKEAGLRYIYMGNVAAGKKGNTFCYKCGEELIDRSGFYTAKNRIVEGKCPECETKIDGVFD